MEQTQTVAIGSKDNHVSAQDLSLHLEHAQVPALVMLTVHITGDTSLLRDKWRPVLAGLPFSGLDEATEAAARQACYDALVPHLDDQQNWPLEPSAELREQMVNWLMGERADEAQAIADAQAMSEVAFAANGHDPRAQQWNLQSINPDSTISAVVIGTGFSGLLAALRFKQAGVPFRILEKNRDVGGTWWENQYPNCRTDVPSHIYTYSFVQEDWETHFGLQEKIHNYLHNFAKDFGLWEHIEFGTEVTHAAWSDEDNTWTVTTKTADGDEQTIDTTLLVSAVGQLNRPSIPNIPGLDTFNGPVIHSAQWDHEIDFTGKKVVVVGTGASALQFAPAVAQVAEQVTIFQRSAPWLRPSPTLRQPVGDGERWLLNNLYQYRAYYRYSIFLPRLVGNLPAATVDPDFNPDEVSVSAANDALRQQLTEYLLDQAGDDAELAKQIVPDYPPAAKRIIRDDGTWVATLKRDNVRLVSQAVTKFDETGAYLNDGEHVEADIILLGTGFAAADFLTPMHVTGVAGKDLHETWGIDASAYMGMTLPDFPNLFLMYGPNTNTVIHGNLVFFLECQAHYIADAARVLAENDKTALNLKPEVFQAYDERVVAESAQRTWGWSKTNSWYMNAEGRSTIMWPHPTREYWEGTREVNPQDYNLS